MDEGGFLTVTVPDFRDQTLVFLHIQKCAGNSLLDLLEGHFPARRVLKAHLLHPGAPELRRAPEEYRLVVGHNTYEDLLSLGLRNPVWMTMLRDPVERVLSLYAFWRSHRTEYIEAHDLRGPRLARAMPLEAFIECPEPEAALNVCNGQARQFLNGLRGEVGLPEELFLQTVLERLEGFAFVGLSDAFGDSVDLLCHRFGWRRPAALRRINDTRQNSLERKRYEPVKRPELTPRLRERIGELNAVDLRLYARMKSRFAADLEALRAAGPVPDSARRPPRPVWRLRRTASNLRNRFLPSGHK